jgi:hypothetical protein
MSITGRLFTVIGIGVVVVALSWSHDAIARQGTHTVDVRNQLVPILQEDIAASDYSVLHRMIPDSDPSFPLRILIESISAVSKSVPTAVVKLQLQNLGDRPLSVPVSREVKVLHYPGNEDRKVFFCSIGLTPPANEEMMFGGVTLYSSSTEPSSRVLLAPKESLQLTFEAIMQRIFEEEELSKWHKQINDGQILAKVVCGQNVLTPRPENVGPPAKRQYWGVTRATHSENKVRLILNP